MTEQAVIDSMYNVRTHEELALITKTAMAETADPDDILTIAMHCTWASEQLRAEMDTHDEWDGQPDEAQEWESFDPDC